MPNYDYLCSNKNCKYNKIPFELKLRMKDAQAYMQCPICNSMGKRFYATPVPFHFKSRGFYSTDYKKMDMGVKGPKLEDMY